MKNSGLIYAWTSAALWLVVSCASPPGTATGSPPSRNDPVSNQVIVSINNYRSANGKKPLTRHAGLDQLASQHSQYLVRHSGSFSLHGTKVSHYGFDSRLLASRRLHSMDSLGENVAAARVDPSRAGNEFLAMWKNSKGHHKQILAEWTHTGIGSATSQDGTVYCTQLFATKNTSQHQMRDIFMRQ